MRSAKPNHPPGHAPPPSWFASRPRQTMRHVPSLVMGSLVINLLSMALPIVLLQVYDRVIPNAAVSTLLVLVSGLAVAVLADSLLRAARVAVAGWNAAAQEHALSCSMAEALLRADLPTLEAQSPGVQLDRLNAVDAVREFHTSEGGLVLVDLPFVCLFLGLIYVIGGSIALVPLAIACVFGTVCLIHGARLRKALAERSDWDDRRVNFAIEVLNGIHSIKAHAMENLMVRRYERLMESTAGATRHIALQSAVAQNLGALFSQLTIGAVAAYGSTLVLSGTLTVGALGACTLLSGRAIQPLLRALGVWTQMQRLAVAKRRIAEVMAFPRESDRAAAMPPIQGHIELRAVTVRYGDLPPILDGVDLEVAPGEVIAISGGNGSGKSTLLGVIAGLLTPTSGVAAIDGIDLAGVDPVSVRRQIAYVPQNGALFQGTIMDNLTLFGGGASPDDAVEAARHLALDEAIARLPEGFATRVGHGAAEALPGGVIQRISVARAVAGQRSILLFDEANSRLDQKSDEQLRAYLASLKGRCSMVLVTYRPSLMRLADRRFVLEGGRLTAVAEVPAAQAAAPGGGETVPA